MQELIKIQKQMSSKQIAELTGKQHSNVLRDIKEMLQVLKMDDSNMIYPDYQVVKDSRNYTAEILINERLSICLAGGYSTLLRMAIIDDWTRMKVMSRKELAQMVVDAEEENERLQLENQKLEVEVKVLAPKAEYTSKVLLSSSTMTTTQIAKDFGMSAIEINKRLCEMGIQFKQRGQYLLGSKYQNKGYMKSVSYIYPDEEGNDKTKLRSVWTEYGKAFLHSLFNKDLSFSKSYACPVPQLAAMI